MLSMKKKIIVNIKFSTYLKYLIVILLTIFSFLLLLVNVRGATAYLVGYTIAILLTYIIKILKCNGKEKYLFCVDIYLNKIILVYKIQDKIIDKLELKHNDIDSFEVIIKANDNGIFGDYSELQRASTIINITTKNHGNIIIKKDAMDRFCGGPFDFALNFIKLSKILPRFTYRIDGNSELAQKEIDYCLKTGHGFNLIQRLFNAGISGIVAGTIIIIVILICLYTLYLIIDTKKMEQCYSIRDKYYNIAQNYYDKKEYGNCIQEIKIGSNYLKKCDKYIGNHEYFALTLFADCKRNLQEYEDAIKIYNDILSRDSETPAIYFKRGKCYYYIGEKETALKDFLNYKFFLNNNKCYYEKKYLNKEIKKVNHWIKLCKNNL